MGTDDEPCHHREINEVEHQYGDRASHASDVRNSAKMSPVGWEALGQWGEDVARIERLAGGVANDVWSVRVHGHLAVGRLGARSDADLAW